MSTPKYFRNFPNIQYAVSANKAGIPTYINIKDYFKLLKVRDDIFREETLYTPYTIHNGQRPDQISKAVYGDEQFYWVILQVNEITNYYTEWPLSELELTEFVYEKYGGATGAGEIHHWQTMDTYDQSTPPNLVLPGQLEVPSTFTFSYSAEPGSNVRLSTTPYSVSNFEYERDLNEKKSQINILDKKYIYDYQREVRKYAENLDPSISFVDISDVNPDS
jgi:hypothetical protein